MGGAFGAVGGDLSAISVNPAGSAVFNNNQVGITLSNQNIKNNSDYFGTQTSDKDNSFILNQAGGVFVFKDRNPNNGWNKIAIERVMKIQIISIITLSLPEQIHHTL